MIAGIVVSSLNSTMKRSAHTCRSSTAGCHCQSAIFRWCCLTSRLICSTIAIIASKPYQTIKCRIAAYSRAGGICGGQCPGGSAKRLWTARPPKMRWTAITAILSDLQCEINVSPCPQSTYSCRKVAQLTPFGTVACRKDCTKSAILFILEIKIARPRWDGRCGRVLD